MDRILFLDFANFAWLANVSFKPKPKQVEGYEDETFPAYDTPPASPPKEEKVIPPENVLIFNFFRNLRALIDPFAPHKIIAVLEGHPAFRYELYADYKANRIIKTGELSKSDIAKSEAKARFDKAYPEILRLLKFLPITTMRHPQYEADDLIGSLVEDAKDEDLIVVSNDSDYIQLLQKGYQHLRLYSPSKKSMVQAPPYHYLTYKIINGDKSDNVRSILSPKKTEALVRDPKKLEEWLNATEENAARFRVNKILVEMAQVPLSEVIVEEGIRNFEALKIEFQQLEFHSLTKTDYWRKFVNSFSSVRF
jgi:5'-3' exonuclease